MDNKIVFWMGWCAAARFKIWEGSSSSHDPFFSREAASSFQGPSGPWRLKFQPRSGASSGAVDLQKVKENEHMPPPSFQGVFTLRLYRTTPRSASVPNEIPILLLHRRNDDGAEEFSNEFHDI
jgi:hypothetical protein